MRAYALSLAVAALVVSPVAARTDQVAPATPVQPASAPTTSAQPTSTTAPPGSPAANAEVRPPDGYVIGPSDVLGVQFWRDDSMSGDAVVRPDGMITLRLLNDIQAAGLTPMQLRDVLMKEGARFLEDPQVTVTVKQINSRSISVLGQVGKQGQLPLNSPLTVLAALGLAGGPNEYAKTDRITIIRRVGKTQQALPFDYKAILNRRKLEQDIFLEPGDIIMVP